MSLTTHSKFYYGYTVDDESNQIDFDEGGGELTAELEVGEYTMTDLATEIERALNAAGANEYTVTVNRSTRIFTVAADANFDLLVSSGSHAGTTAFTTFGFTGADRTGTDTYDGNAAAGTEYSTQFILQSHVSSEDLRGALFSTVNKSASGKSEVVTFGEEAFTEFNMKYVTDIAQGSGGPIRNRADGVSQLRTFMRHIITRAPVEFMPDEDTPATFESLELESTPEDQNGLKYRLKELYANGLPGYFETGVLKFRVIED